MPYNEKKEPGRPNVEQPERGDPRQHEQPIEKVNTGNVGNRPDSRPAPGQRDDDSPWMGGG